jgi:hypothetical protein
LRSSRVRFTLGNLLTAVAVLAFLSWLVVGLDRGVAGLIGYPPVYLVVAFPFLLASFATFIVTVFQARRVQRQEQKVVSTSPSACKLKVSVLTIAVSLGVFVTATAAGFFLLPGRWIEFVRPAIRTMLKMKSLPDAVDLEPATSVPASDTPEAALDEGVPVQRASLRLPNAKALPFPPLPTRYSPGPLPRTATDTTVERRALLPVPPVPSKAPPGLVPDRVQGNANAGD